jgi:hypothetical protein
MKLLVIALLIFSFLSCGKSDDIAPVIQMISPADNALIAPGDPLTTKATITDNEGIHMVHLQITDLSNNGHVVHNEDHFDGKTYELNNSFIPVSGRSYAIHIDATDHNNNVAQKDLVVMAQ